VIGAASTTQISRVRDIGNRRTNQSRSRCILSHFVIMVSQRFTVGKPGKRAVSFAFSLKILHRSTMTQILSNVGTHVPVSGSYWSSTDKWPLTILHNYSNVPQVGIVPASRLPKDTPRARTDTVIIHTDHDWSERSRNMKSTKYLFISQLSRKSPPTREQTVKNHLQPLHHTQEPNARLPTP
jgi:hypothetical protein